MSFVTKKTTGLLADLEVKSDSFKKSKVVLEQYTDAKGVIHYKSAVVAQRKQDQQY